eukprot:scaffold164265_cov22-Tisochrysis_lutea.AAC.2
MHAKGLSLDTIEPWSSRNCPWHSSTEPSCLRLLDQRLLCLCVKCLAVHGLYDKQTWEMQTHQHQLLKDKGYVTC